MLLWRRATCIRKSGTRVCSSVYTICVYVHLSALLPFRFPLSSSLMPSLHLQPTEGPGLVDTFVCHCTDCRKVTASMFASNFTIDDTYLKHLRGRDNLSAWSQSRTIESGNTMTNHFCKTCGTLMYRVSSGMPGKSILRIGTVDDFNLHETKLKPRRELFIRSRVGWFPGVDLEGVKCSQDGGS